MILLELFSGIGGFAKGFEQAGYEFTKHYYSEIDKHAIANYKHNFQNAEYIGAIENISGKEIEKPDIITFGFPCQDLSNAGKRKGLGGKRSSLFYEAIRIIKETKPEIFIFENVKGLLSSNSGKDFISVLQTISNIGLYECEWQLVNTKWVIPQNRERIFFIGHLAGKSQRKVFPIGENDIIVKKKYAKKKRIYSQNNTSCLNGQHKLRGDNTYILVEPQHKHGGNLRIYNNNAPTIQSRYGTGGDNIPYVVQLSGSKESGGKQPYQQNRVYSDKGIIPALNSLSGKFNILTKKLRRLTEIECERLQGFSDNWTKYGNYDGTVKEIPMTARYKMLGNAVTVNIVEIIAKKLKQK